MADVAALEQSGVKGENVPTSPTQKRKRGTESSSPESRRSKRGTAATTTIPQAVATDASAQAYMENALETAQAASNMSAADFTALQQATVDHSDVGHSEVGHTDVSHNDVSDPANASSTAAAALGSMYPTTLHVPQSTEETFAASQVGVESDHHAESPFNATADGLPMDSPLDGLQQPGANGVKPELRYAAGQKPAVGSEEWHKVRKDNHKEVERRRRETINEGINELAKIVPGCEKNKGSILQRSVAFITQLKENETQNIEKWTLEKLLTEQAIAELSTTNDKLKQECERLYRELESWKHVAQAAGLSPEPKESS